VDSQTHLEDAAAVAALFHVCSSGSASATIWASRSHGRDEPDRRERCRAGRYGTCGFMVDPVTGEQVETRVRDSQLLDHLEPTAERYGTSWALLTARALLADNGADRQRYFATERGLMALARWLAQETVSSARDYLERRT
jgi:gamma-glutamyl:cysteine ligase YbdK (ATP-grasp superfamily)